MSVQTHARTRQHRGVGVWLGPALGCLFLISNCVQLDTENHCLTGGGDSWCRAQHEGTWWCIVEYAGGAPVDNDNGDGCLDHVPACVDEKSCIWAQYGLPRAISNGDAPAGSSLDTIEEQLLEIGCSQEILHAIDATLADPVIELREKLEDGEGCASTSSLTLNADALHSIEMMNSNIGTETADCTNIRPKCMTDEECADNPRYAFCIENECVPCPEAKEQYDRDCNTGFVCNNSSGNCDKICSAPEVNYENTCMTCDEIPEPAQGEPTDPADEACETAAILANTTTFVCDRDAGQCVTCTEDKIQACADGEICNPAQECVECIANSDCNSIDFPYCSPTGSCLPCGGADTSEASDTACSESDATRPICENENCVSCRQGTTNICDAQLLVCDPANNECVQCTSHSQCMGSLGSACHIDTGDCLPPNRVWHVDADAVGEGDGTEDSPYQTIGSALGNISPGAQGTIILHEASVPYNEDAPMEIDGARVVAIVAPASERPVIVGDHGNGLFVVSDLNTVAYLEGLEVRNNEAGAGVAASAEARVYIDRCEIFDTLTGIDIEGGAHLELRSSIISSDVDTLPAVSLDNVTAEIVYSTLVHSDFSATPNQALFCSGSQMKRIRNSIIVSRSLGVNGWQCEGGVITSSVGENIPRGDGNIFVCDTPQIDCDMGDPYTGLFVEIELGPITDFDLRLIPTGEVFRVTPDRLPNDPNEDIDLNPRPAVSGIDYAGAHIPQVPQ